MQLCNTMYGVVCMYGSIMTPSPSSFDRTSNFRSESRGTARAPGEAPPPSRAAAEGLGRRGEDTGRSGKL